MQPTDTLRAQLGRLLDSGYPRRIAGVSESTLDSFLLGQPIGREEELLLSEWVHNKLNKEVVRDTANRSIHAKTGNTLGVSGAVTDDGSIPSSASQINEIPFSPDLWGQGTPSLIAQILDRSNSWNSDEKNRYGALLRQQRESLRISLEEFAERFGLNTNELREIESWTGPGDVKTVIPLSGISETKTSSEAKADVTPTYTDAPDQIGAIGLSSCATRHATREEMGLEADREAAAIAAFFRTAVGEFCFALLAPWGRGKTYLMSLVSDILEKDHNYRTVWFNAWKYRSTPELWAHLYQAFVDNAGINQKREDDSRWRRWLSSLPNATTACAFAIRASLLKYGFLAIAITTWSTLIFTLPFAILLNSLLVLTSIFGIGWLLYFSHMKHAGEVAATSILTKYAKLADHRSKLGAQALIADDLKALVASQIPLTSFGTRSTITAKAIVLILVPLVASIAICAGVAYRDYWTGMDVFFTVLPSLDDARLWISLAIWWIAFLSMIFLVIWLPRPCNKMLLVVDDLDRCEPSQMLEVIEAIKLLIEDHELQSRIQVAMLIQEEHLRHAIAGKFPIAKEEPYCPIVDEHLDKLFIAHLRLEPLDMFAIHDVADGYITYSRQQALADLKRRFESQRGSLRNDATTKQLEDEIRFSEQDIETLPKTLVSTLTAFVNRRDGMNSDTNTNGDNQQSPGEVRREAGVQQRYLNTPYTTDEHQRLLVALERLTHAPVDSSGSRNEKASSGRQWVPRRVRSFLFKYQLARLLMNASGIDWKAQQLIENLEGAMEDATRFRRNTLDNEDSASRRIKRVVLQVV
jgi:hypothetical protein